ncbi:MAG: hypothetical protein AB7V08_05560 [Elusimicrobiales bacterium]
MNIKTIVAGLLAGMALLWVPAAYAADNSTEFGIEDDLTVLGTGGAVTPADPDLEVKGFTVFGSTQTAYTGMAAPAAGDVVVNGYLAVSSGAYFVGGSTFAAGGAYFTGVSSFSNVANVHFGGGAPDQVLKKAAGGGMQWTNVSDMVSGDNLGSHIATTTLQMANNEIMAAGHITASSVTLSGQMIVIGSSTLTGNTGVGGTLGVTGAATFNGAVTLGNEAADAVTVNGNADLNGTINADGDAAFNANVDLGSDLTDIITVKGQSSFVAGSTFSAGAYFTDISSFSDVAKVHFGGGAPDQVLKKAAGGGMQWTNVSDMVSGDNLGSHIATTTLQMANNEIMNAGHITASSATLTQTFNVAGAVDFDTTLNVEGSATLRGNNQLGDAFTDDHGINVAPEDGVALKVAGEDVSNKYAAKFYSGANLAAWIRKK